MKPTSSTTTPSPAKTSTSSSGKRKPNERSKRQSTTQSKPQLPHSKPRLHISLRRVYLDSYGYTRDGRYYFGIGPKLWEYTTETDRIRTSYVRAIDLNTAKQKISEIWSGYTIKWTR